MRRLAVVLTIYGVGVMLLKSVIPDLNPTPQNMALVVAGLLLVTEP